jgi:uncharacterized membrane protein YbhN (UPF0104 family)
MSESRSKNWGSWIFLVLQILIAGAILWWILSQPGFFASFVTAWQNVHPGWLTAGLACAGISIAAHVWRWWICLRLLGLSTSWTMLARVFLASSFVGTFVIGGIGGDAARVIMLTRQFPGSTSRLMVSVLADRLCGLISLILPALIFTFPVREVLSSTSAGKLAVHFLWGYLVFSTLLFLFCWFCGTENARRWLPRWMPARKWMLHVSDCFELLRPSGAKLLSAVAASVLMLALHFATFWCIARGCEAGVSLQEITTVMPVVEAATTVPATPGGIGMREKLFQDQLASLSGTSSGASFLISLGGFLCGLVWCLFGGLAAASLLPRSLSLKKHAGISA